MNLEFRNSKQDSLREIVSYIINLSSRADRRGHALDQVSTFRLNSILVDAISVQELGPMNLGFLSPPAMACWQSHIKSFEYFLETNNSYACVFEDDFEIKNMPKLERYIKKLKMEDFDIIQVGFLVNNYRERVEILLKNMEFLFFFLLARACLRSSFFSARYENKLRVQRAQKVPIGFVPDDLRAGAHAYLVSRKAALSIVSVYKNQNILTTDGFLIATNWTRPFRTLRLYKSFVDQIQSQSSIR